MNGWLSFINTLYYIKYGIWKKFNYNVLEDNILKSCPDKLWLWMQCM